METTFAGTQLSKIVLRFRGFTDPDVYWKALKQVRALPDKNVRRVTLAFVHFLRMIQQLSQRGRAGRQWAKNVEAGLESFRSEAKLSITKMRGTSATSTGGL